MELTPGQRQLQEANRAARAKAAAKARASEAEIAAWGLSPETAMFFSILAHYTGNEEEAEVPIDTDALREEWGRMSDDTDERLIETRMFDLVDERDDGNLYLSSLGKEAIQHLF